MQDDQYFSVAHRLSVNVEPLSPSTQLPDEAAFEDEIPTPFKLANDNAAASPGLHRALGTLGEAGKEIGQYLKSQSDKLNMVLSYVLSLQDDAEHRTHTSHFGGSQLNFYWPQALTPGHKLKIKLFIPEESAALYCYGEVIQCQTTTNGHLIECRYSRIREQDREMLVRASLHIQAKQLQQRADARRSDTD